MAANFFVRMDSAEGRWIDDIEFDADNIPSSDEKAALAGTSGTPSGSNKYVTHVDSRMSDARTPTEHGNTQHSEDYLPYEDTSVQTTNDSWTQVAYVAVAAGELVLVRANVIGKSASASVGAFLEGVYRRVSTGNVAEVADPYVRGYNRSDSMDVQMREDTGNQRVVIEVKGTDTITTDWDCRVYKELVG